MELFYIILLSSIVSTSMFILFTTGLLIWRISYLNRLKRAYERQATEFTQSFEHSLNEYLNEHNDYNTKH